MSINVEYNNKESVEIILTNVFKMLERRNVIQSWKDQIKDLDFTKLTFDFIAKDKSKYSINFVNAKLLSIIGATIESQLT